MRGAVLAAALVCVVSAHEGMDTFLRLYWSEAAAYVVKFYPSDGNLSEYWNYAQCYDAVLDGVELQRAQGVCAPLDYAGYAEKMYAGQEARGWGRDYMDDMNWMALALLRAYDLFGDDKYLQTASMLFDKIQGAWDSLCCGDLCGGIWWDTAHTQKATASNAGPVITAVRLYSKTKNPTILSFAQKVFDFWWANMVDQNTFQVADHFDGQGSKTWWKFTYNEGLVVGACVAMYNATRDASYLDKAHSVASFMCSSETVQVPSYGPVLNDGTADRCSDTDCAQFKGIGFRYLHALNAVAPRSQYKSVLTACPKAIYGVDQQAATGLFGPAWQGPAPDTTVAINNAEEASALTALLLGAMDNL
eukprot:TRINITY_DN17277_c0_g1_i1.p1 TRINITY_DN17277_c0_g1~~TRINITY_DN17277_c0_g1_i1.p1  ORF type:complete len:361 (-),score=58.18 TRINITY_DN17277_c0_g1_i1:79-1161(-)